MSSWKSLSDIYTEGVVKGEGDRSQDIADIYSKEVLHEANITITYKDNRPPQELNISDERAEQLAQIASDVSPARNQVLYKMEGKWVGQRFDQKQVKSLDTHARKIADKGRIRSRIERIARSSHIFTENQLVSGFSTTLNLIHDFLERSAIKTLENNGNIVNEESIKRKTSDILTAIETKELQRYFIKKVESNSVGKFNLWEVSKEAGDAGNIIFDPLEGDLVLRPAGDEKATRGAAGPGEALLAFLYGGTKPKGAGDILLDNEEGHTIELKKNEGRIGKGVNSADVKKINKLLNSSNISNAEIQDIISKKSGISGDVFYGYPKDIDEFINLYKIEFPNSNSIPDDKSYISASDIIKLYEYATQKNENNVASKIVSTYFNTQKLPDLVFKRGAPRPDRDLYVGTFRPGEEENINNVKLIDFFKNYSGVKKGDKPVSISPLESDITVSEAMQRAPGDNPREKIGNLIGVWHLKYYMTHIQPFTWLLVYKPDGRAGVISYNAIIETSPLELLEKIGEANIKFGIRMDNEGFDIQLQLET